MHVQDDLVIITGGPGAGKTTLIAALAGRGLATAPESGRAVIRAQMAIDGTALPWRDRAAFAEAMLEADMHAYREAAGSGRITLFDRGIPDVAGYLRLCGLPVPATLDEAAHCLRYRREVFIAPPWPAIYVNDAERRQDFAEAQRTHEAMVATYREFGYDLVALPCVPVAARADFVMAHLRGLGRAAREG